MDRAIAVGHGQRLTKRVDGQHILERAAAGPGGGIGVADFLDQVVGVQAGTSSCGDAIDPFRHLLPTGSKNYRVF